jgi:hypothetical protein
VLNASAAVVNPEVPVLTADARRKPVWCCHVRVKRHGRGELCILGYRW